MTCPFILRPFILRPAADALGETAELIHRAAEVFVKPLTPRRINQRRAILGGKDDVVMQGEKCRRHNGVWLASRRDAFVFARIVSGGVASLHLRLMARNPSG